MAVWTVAAFASTFWAFYDSSKSLHLRSPWPARLLAACVVAWLVMTVLVLSNL